VVVRWCGAGLLEAKKQFRRVKGYMHLRKLREALEAHVSKSVTAFATQCTKGGGPGANNLGTVTKNPQGPGLPRCRVG
jgi:hypothetical protein